MSKTIQFFFDFSSPYAYLAHVRLPGIASRYGCSISYRPVDLSEIKRAAGNIGPSAHFLAARQHYVRQDTARWARRYGVPISTPANFNSGRLNRGVFMAIERDVATKYVDVVGQRVWGAGRAMDDTGLMDDIALDMGWDPAQFARYVSSSAAEASHQAALALARECGVFGVPTMMVDEHLWWGNDRLQFVESCLAADADSAAQSLERTDHHG